MVPKITIHEAWYHKVSRSADQQIGRSADQQISRPTIMISEAWYQADQQISRSADQQTSNSADQQLSRSADQQISRSADQRISRSADRQISGSADQQISRSADQQISRSADQQTKNHDFCSMVPKIMIHEAWYHKVISFFRARGHLALLETFPSAVGNPNNRSFWHPKSIENSFAK